MTVIAVVVDDAAGRVHMAADSIATDHNGTTMEMTKLSGPPAMDCCSAWPASPWRSH